MFDPEASVVLLRPCTLCGAESNTALACSHSLCDRCLTRFSHIPTHTSPTHEHRLLYTPQDHWANKQSSLRKSFLRQLSEKYFCPSCSSFQDTSQDISGEPDDLSLNVIANLRDYFAENEDSDDIEESDSSDDDENDKTFTNNSHRNSEINDENIVKSTGRIGTEAIHSISEKEKAYSDRPDSGYDSPTWLNHDDNYVIIEAANEIINESTESETNENSIDLTGESKTQTSDDSSFLSNLDISTYPLLIWDSFVKDPVFTSTPAERRTKSKIGHANKNTKRNHTPEPIFKVSELEWSMGDKSHSEYVHEAPDKPISDKYASNYKEDVQHSTNSTAINVKTCKDNDKKLKENKNKINIQANTKNYTNMDVGLKISDFSFFKDEFVVIDDVLQSPNKVCQDSGLLRTNDLEISANKKLSEQTDKRSMYYSGKYGHAQSTSNKQTDNKHCDDQVWRALRRKEPALNEVRQAERNNGGTQFNTVRTPKTHSMKSVTNGDYVTYSAEKNNSDSQMSKNKQIICNGDVRGHGKQVCNENSSMNIRPGARDMKMRRAQIQGSKSVYCARHPESAIKFHCSDCDKYVCLVCRNKYHQDHSGNLLNLAKLKKYKHGAAKKIAMGLTLDTTDDFVSDPEDYLDNLTIHQSRRCELGSSGSSLVMDSSDDQSYWIDHETNRSYSHDVDKIHCTTSENPISGDKSCDNPPHLLHDLQNAKNNLEHHIEALRTNQNKAITELEERKHYLSQMIESWYSKLSFKIESSFTQEIERAEIHLNELNKNITNNEEQIKTQVKDKDPINYGNIIKKIEDIQKLVVVLSINKIVTYDMFGTVQCSYLDSISNVHKTQEKLPYTPIDAYEMHLRNDSKFRNQHLSSGKVASNLEQKAPILHIVGKSTTLRHFETRSNDEFEDCLDFVASGLCLMPEGRLLVTDVGQDGVNVFSATGTKRCEVNLLPDDHPTTAVITADNHIAVATKSCVKLFTLTGKFIRKVRLVIESPQCLAVMPNGDVAVSGTLVAEHCCDSEAAIATYSPDWSCLQRLITSGSLQQPEHGFYQPWYICPFPALKRMIHCATEYLTQHGMSDENTMSLHDSTLKSEEAALSTGNDGADEITECTPHGKAASALRGGSHVQATDCPDVGVVVSDRENHSVKAYSAGGQLLWRAGGRGAGPGKLLYPAGLVVDRFGHVLVADSGNGRVVMLSCCGRWLGTVAHDDDLTAPPTDLALDPHTGHLLVLQDGGQVSVLRYLS